jgi:hypothetical protein
VRASTAMQGDFAVTRSGCAVTQNEFAPVPTKAGVITNQFAAVQNNNGFNFFLNNKS